MKTLLLFSMVVLLNTLMYGQETNNTSPAQTDVIIVSDTVNNDTAAYIIDLSEDSSLIWQTEKYLRDSMEWYSAYEARLAAITIYPNPTRGEIHISGLDNRDNELWILQLMDCDGRLIYSTKLNPNERNINLPEVGIGSYIIRLLNGNTSYPFRISIYN